MSSIKRRFYIKDSELIPSVDYNDLEMDKFCKLFIFRYCPFNGITQTLSVTAHLEKIDYRGLFAKSKNFLVVRFPVPVGESMTKIYSYEVPNNLTLSEAYKKFVFEVNKNNIL